MRFAGPSEGPWSTDRRCIEADFIVYRAYNIQGLRILQVPQPVSGRSASQAARNAVQRTPPRLRAVTWNMGGCTSDAYDVMCAWLEQQTTLDVLFIQETHFGLGKQAAQWSIRGWTFCSSPDPQNRYAGIAVAVSHRLADPNDMTFCEWLPGRVLQVRAEASALNVDLLAVYQWVRERNPTEDKQSKRDRVWQVLGRALHSIPRRHLLLLGGDLNSSLRSHANLVGRGLLRKNNDRVDEELMSIITEHRLCVLNSWGPSRASKSATFRNGSRYSQLDYFLVRKHAADSMSRRSQPTQTDLTPWKQGPRHFMLECSIPKVAGWRLEQQVRPMPRVVAFSKEDMRWHMEHRTDHFLNFQARVTEVVEQTLPSTPVCQLNTSLLQLCCDAFPTQARQTCRAGSTAAVRGTISHMWAMHRALRARRPGTSFLQIFAACRRYIRFMQAWRAVRATGRRVRRQRIEELVQRASSAAERHDMREMYRVVKLLAPKSRYEAIRIRSQDGAVLTQKEQFDEIYDYFRTAFARADNFDPGPRLAFAVHPTEVEAAIGCLKPHKAVPVHSPPAEVWQTAPKPLAQYFAQHLQHCRERQQPLPAETTDCQLALLPKPGRPSRRPKDLRPLGLQDPCSKILACILRDKLVTHIVPWMIDKPQYAYLPGRSIDAAILRVCKVCDTIKARLQQSQDTVHSRRQSRPVPRCTGGALLSLDLSRAFDMLPRWALLQSLQAASVPEDLSRIVLELHEQCHYGIRHNRYQGRFEMQLGVRQGCVLSPLLFAAFTGLFYEKLRVRTSDQWAEQFVTLFADDTMLQWCVESEQDLKFLERCVRVTFELFHELGMQVNASKSKLILVLKRGIAKRWLRRKRLRSGQGYIIRFGSPAFPLDIPHVVSTTYLGVEISLDNYIQRTCRLRLKMAASIRQRLLKVLHTAGLGLRTRVLLYTSCVRSSMLYGQHAVGFTPSMLRMLDQRDSRYLRALSRSPAHITHESTEALRRRLRVKSPAEVFLKMLQGRVRGRSGCCRFPGLSGQS